MITMSNRCTTNLFNNTLPFNTPLKPHCNILCLISRFRNNRVLIGRKSTRRKFVAAHSSSSDIVLVATTVNRDGSLVFRFGDASEVVKNDEVVENNEVVENDELVDEIESRIEGDGNVVNVLDGDQVRQVIVKTIERGFRTDEGILTEVPVGISNADIVSKVSESESNVISGLSDYLPEFNEVFSDDIEEEVLSLQSDVEEDSLEGVESTDKMEYTAQLYEDESADPVISLLENSPNADESGDPKGTRLQENEDEPDDPSVTVKLESTEGAQIEVMDVKESYAGVESEKVESEDISSSEHKYLAAGNEKEELQEMNISEAALIDEILPSDPLDVELADAANDVVEEELQDANTFEVTGRDDMPSSDPLGVDAADAANEVVDEIRPSNSLNVELTDTANQVVVEELQETNTFEVTLIDDVPPSDPLVVAASDATNEVVEEKLQEANNAEVTLINEMISSDPLGVELMDTANEAAEEELLDIKIDEVTRIDEMLPSDPVEAETTVGVNEDVKQELQDMNITEGTLIDERLPSDSLEVDILDAAAVVVEEELQEMNFCQATLINEMLPSDSLDVKLVDTANEVVKEELQDPNISEGTVVDEMLPSDAFEVKFTVFADGVAEEELQDVNITEGTLTNELRQPDALDVDLTDDAIEGVEEMLQDININEATLIDEFEPSNPLGVELTSDEAEETMEDSSTKAKDQFKEEELQQVSTNNNGESDFPAMIPLSGIEKEEPIVEEEVSLPPSITLEVNPTMQVSDIEPVNTKDQNPDDGFLQVNDESENQSVSVKPETTQVSHTEVMDVTQSDPQDESQKLETEDTSCKGDKDLMPSSIVEEEESQPELTPLKLEPTMQVLDTEFEDAIGENLNDETLQVTSESEDLSVFANPQNIQVSHIEVMDVAQANAEEELQPVETEDVSEGEVEELLPPAIMQISDIEMTGSANEDVKEGLQDMDISEGTLIDDTPPSDPLGSGPILAEVSQLQISNIQLEETMEVMNTEGTPVTGQVLEDEFQQVTTDNTVENDVANVMPSEPIQEEEVDQLQSVTSTIQLSDIKVQDATDENLEDEILQVIDEVAGDSYILDVDHASHQLEAPSVQDEEVILDIVEESAESDALGGTILLTESADDPLLETERTEHHVSSDEHAESSEDMDLLIAAEAEIERKDIYLNGEFLSSGAALWEHPNKALTGGDDACFVAGSKWLGVANGVSPWSFEGTNPGAYAKELMRTCEDIVSDTSNVPVTNPVELLCRCIKETSLSGSSNVLIANFDGQALHVANVGDTGFLILRHGAIYKKSSPLLHEFHFALQVEDSDDPLQLVEEHTIELEEGDIVVSATDGLFDNLYKREIAMIVSKSLQAGMKPEEIANMLATRAQEVGRSTSVRSPFSDAAQTAGYTGYVGGKPDNVAVIVSLVERISNSLAD